MDYRQYTDSSIKCYATLENPKNSSADDRNKFPTHRDLLKGNRMIANDVKDRKGELQVTAIGQVALPPTKAQFKITICSCKGNFSDAETSTNRRLEYVLQTLHNNGLKDDCIDISNNINRIEKSKFLIKTEIVAHLTDFKKCEILRNFFVSKLDESVDVSRIVYLHDSFKATNLRQQALVAAVKSAQAKASGIANIFRGTVGQPIFIKEVHSDDWLVMISNIYMPKSLVLTVTRSVDRMGKYPSIAASPLLYEN
ncbi:uncharacterized protein TRIADDRAFT_56460 [Trichoplax adhaerens]|uniref:Uncharacterized protein n=1 Tax=Trichoplax adhaerens TaxID=10228 RepID=B3RY73_TRIAD|nr:hypothetical protein TRIADDRAFT_56460 [Trichoplax adhaerens]EDV24984.1 hypothetical protein TRIADDRAFT_56460 [Trichoplax adhaerens]|eukprot:XP_002112874.1 hypothetical protein TRIADDRAFT_56460 [Trichoplax adhaerens]